MAQIRAFYETLEWREWSDNDITYVSTTSFSTDALDGNMTTVFTAGRRVKAVAATPGTIYGTVVSSSHGGSITTVVVGWDSGVLASEPIDIFVGFDQTGSSIPGGTPVGSVTSYLGAAAPAGWLLLNGDTMGATASAATQASDLYEALYTLIYDNFADAQAAVSSGRGASAAADWAANKTIALPDAMGRVIAGVEATATRLTAASKAAIDGALMGTSGGVEEYTLLTAEMPSHTHAQDALTGLISGSGGAADATGSDGKGGTTGSAGSGQAHTNVQPTILFSWIVKW